MDRKIEGNKMKKDFPLSVVMPVYNAEKYLRDSIESILNQTYENFEFIIVDNMSTDNSLSIIEEYAKRDKRIKIHQCRKKGFSHALNLGVDKANFNWIARMDADDISLPHRLKTQVKFIQENPMVSAIGSYGYYMDATGKRILGKIKIGPTSIEEFRKMVKWKKLVFILNVSMIIRKDIFKELGGYRDLPILEDLDFNCRMAEKGHIALVQPEYLVKVRKTYRSETSSKFFLAQNVMRWIKDSTIRRSKGEKEIPLNEFLESLKKEPLLRRINRYRKDMGAYYFKRAGLALSYRKPFRFIAFMTAAMLLDPAYTIEKIVRIKFP